MTNEYKVMNIPLLFATPYYTEGPSSMDPASSCTLPRAPDCKAYPAPGPEALLKLLDRQLVGQECQSLISLQ